MVKYQFLKHYRLLLQSTDELNNEQCIDKQTLLNLLSDLLLKSKSILKVSIYFPLQKFKIEELIKVELFTTVSLCVSNNYSTW